MTSIVAGLAATVAVVYVPLLVAAAARRALLRWQQARDGREAVALRALGQIVTRRHGAYRPPPPPADRHRPTV